MLGEYSALALNQNSTFEVSTTPWSALGGASIARSSNYAYRGYWSLLITPSPGGVERSISGMSGIPGAGEPGGFVPADPGAPGASTAPGAQSEAVPVTAGYQYTASAQVMAPWGWNGITANLAWQNAGGTIVSVTTGTAYTVPMGAWIQVQTSAFAPAGAGVTQAAMQITFTGTPGPPVDPCTPTRP